MSLLKLISEAKRTGDYAAFAKAIPYVRFLGITALCEGQELIGKLNYSQMLIGNPHLPALHGGTLGALMESTATFLLLRDANDGVIPKIINITIEYLRSGRPRDTFARGVITKQGRRVTNVRVEAWQDDRERPIAIAYANFLLAKDSSDGSKTPVAAGSEPLKHG